VPKRSLLAGVALAGAAWTLPALAPVVPALAGPLGIELTHGTPGGVALTFDDGPHPEGTPAVLEALAAAGAVATFFLVGEQVERRPALVARIVEAGHGVELHGYRHPNLLRVPPPALARDLDRGAAVVSAASGRPIRLHRAPLGIYTPAALTAVRRRGWTPTLWSRWGRDWTRRATAESISAKAAGTLQEGDVILLHDADYYSARDSWRATAAALPAILDRIAAAGLRTVVLQPR
jgi:peptidoglycan/xylan/chitin deacetylase (PgdA/CDA1 family)